MNRNHISLNTCLKVLFVMIQWSSCCVKLARGFQRTRAFSSSVRPSPTAHHWRQFASTADTTTSSSRTSSGGKSSDPKKSVVDSRVLNLSTVTKEELEAFVVNLGHPKFRSNQVWQWIRGQGITDVNQMSNIPKQLRAQLSEFSKSTALELAFEMISKDGTVKRAYKCHDGQVIESVLMPYETGRYTACISSQAGCAQGCVFCATGQMGFSRQLTSDEIFEQVARFANELQQLSKQEEKEEKETKQQRNNNNKKQPSSDEKTKSHGRTTRLSNIVFMGMGEPLANLKNVKTAIQRINQELGIGARRITVSTVGIVPNIRRMFQDPDMPPVRLAVSLHCASDEERTALLPANRRNGGLQELMACLKEYMDQTGQRITLEWALIEGQNDGVETARQLGRLVTQGYGDVGGLRRDMVHVNVIPLNPTGGFGGTPSGRARVNLFCQTLEQEFKISCTPRVRRGIDIDAGCGQLKAKVMEREKAGAEGVSEETVEIAAKATFETKEGPALSDFIKSAQPQVGVYEEMQDDVEDEEVLEFAIEDDALDMDDEDDEDFIMDMDGDDEEFEDVEYAEGSWESQEAARLIAMVKGTTIHIPTDVVSSSTKNLKP